MPSSARDSRGALERHIEGSETDEFAIREFVPLQNGNIGGPVLPRRRYNPLLPRQDSKVSEFSSELGSKPGPASIEAQFAGTGILSRPPARGRTVLASQAAPVFLQAPGEDPVAGLHQIVGLLDAPAHEHSEIAVLTPPGPCCFGRHVTHAEHVNRDFRSVLAGKLPLERREEFPAIPVTPFFCLADVPIGHSEAFRRSCERRFHAAGN